VGNDSNQTYIGQEGQTFAFSLPAGATQTVFQNDRGGTRFIRNGSNYSDTKPVLPGREGLSIVALYSIPYSADSLIIEVPLSADVAAVDVLIDGETVNLSSDQVAFTEKNNFQGTTFSIYSGTNLSKSESLVLNLSGLGDLEFGDLPAIPEHEGLFSSSLDQNRFKWIIIAIGAMVIVGVTVVYPTTRSQPILTTNVKKDPSQDNKNLLLLLAHLDELYEAGELDEAIYRQARAKYKAQLLKIMA